VISAAAALGWPASAVLASPITGPAGNHEYLLWLGGGGEPPSAEQLAALVAATLAAA
jgi:23S rRNA (cytidine1920-2'-O)/16S rRNA (cytidine1409-2'-O)-methyltransferase